MTSAISYIDNRMENEDWENLRDVIEEAIEKFGMESVEKELTENNSNYLEYFWDVQDQLASRISISADLDAERQKNLAKWEQSITKQYWDDQLQRIAHSYTVVEGGSSRAGGDRQYSAMSPSGRSTSKPYKEVKKVITLAVWEGKGYDVRLFQTKEEFLKNPQDPKPFTTLS